MSAVHRTPDNRIDGSSAQLAIVGPVSRIRFPEAARYAQKELLQRGVTPLVWHAGQDVGHEPRPFASRTRRRVVPRMSSYIPLDTIWPGTPHPLGATWDGHGVNFAIFSEHAEKVEPVSYTHLTLPTIYSV